MYINAYTYICALLKLMISHSRNKQSYVDGFYRHFGLDYTTNINTAILIHNWYFWFYDICV